jgi:hypothetical protein
MRNVRIQELEDAFKEIFQDVEGKVSSIDTVYEMSDNEDYYKLVISIHNLSVDDTLIIHTKFIFKTDKNKQFITEESFIYLYDINCVYHKVDFDNIIDLKTKVEDVIKSNDFGEDLQILSDFIEAPAMFLNYYMKRAKITDYSIFDVKYEPKFKTTPCNKTTFDFEININNNYIINLSISKKEREKDEDYDTYKFQFKFLDEYKTVENDTLNNIHFTIGSNIAKILDEKLK